MSISHSQAIPLQVLSRRRFLSGFALAAMIDMGWRAGFHGPWCIEQLNKDSREIFRQLRWLKSQLDAWIGESSAQPISPR